MLYLARSATYAESSRPALLGGYCPEIHPGHRRVCNTSEDSVAVLEIVYMCMEIYVCTSALARKVLEGHSGTYEY